MEGINLQCLELLSDADILKLKRQHKIEKIVQISVCKDGDTQMEHFYFKPMTIEIYSAMLKVGQDDVMRGAKIIFKNCLIHGDKTASDDLRFLGILPKIDVLTTTFKTEVKEL